MEIIESKITDMIDKERFIFGFADLDNLLDQKYSRYKYGIVIGKKLDDEIMDSISSGPTPQYFEHYRDTNRELSSLAQHLKKELKSLNFTMEVIEPSISEDERDEQYFKTLNVGFSHKMVATRAGLGWIGKTALLITHEFGPRVRLVSLLTDYPLDYCRSPVNESRCGECNVCVEKCPAGAASGELWHAKLDRKIFFDAFKCRRQCLKFSLEQGAPICGICVSVCPIGKKEKISS
jgi:epoxyqueuosine reductase QueG